MWPRCNSAVGAHPIIIALRRSGRVLRMLPLTIEGMQPPQGVVGADIGRDTRRWGKWSVPTTLRSRVERHQQSRVGPVSATPVVFDWLQLRRGSGIRLSAAGGSNPAGGSWGTPVTIVGKKQRSNVNLGTPAGPFVRMGLTGASRQSCNAAVVTATFGSPAVLLRDHGNGCCRR